MSAPGVPALSLSVVRRDQLSRREYSAIVAFCTEAYEEEMAPLFQTFAGSTHVVGRIGGVLVSHALWIPRVLQPGEHLGLRTAYVEAVATAAAHRRRGYAAAVMRRVAEEVRDWELAALSPFDTGYYGRLGWERWQGPLYARTTSGLEQSPNDEEVMILRLPATPPLDVREALSVEWREGDVW